MCVCVFSFILIVRYLNHVLDGLVVLVSLVQISSSWWQGPVDITVCVHWLLELCLAHGDIRDH